MNRLLIALLAALASGIPAGAEVTDVHSTASIQATAIARDDLSNFQFDTRPLEQAADFASFARQQSAAADGALVDGQVNVEQDTTLSVGSDTLVLRSTARARQSGERKRVEQGLGETVIADGGGNGATNLFIEFSVTERASFSISSAIELAGDPPGRDNEDGGQNNASFVLVGSGGVFEEFRVGDGRGDARRGSVSDTGVLEPGSYSLFVGLEVRTPFAPTSTASWRVTFSVGPDETGDEFVWVGGSSGAFGDAENWSPPLVPSFVDGDRNDRASFESGPNPTVDFGAVAASRGPRTNPARSLGALRVNRNRRVVLDAPVITLKSRAPSRPALDVSGGGSLTVQGLTVLESPTTSLGNTILGGGGGPASLTIGADALFFCPGPVVIGAEAEFKVLGGSADCTDSDPGTVNVAVLEGIAEVQGASGEWLTQDLQFGLLEGQGALGIVDGRVESLEANLFGGSATISGASRDAPGTWNAGTLHVFGGLIEVLSGGLVSAAGVELGGASEAVGAVELLGGKLEVATDLFLKGAAPDQLPGRLKVASGGVLDVGGRIEIQGGELSLEGPPFSAGEAPSAVDVLVRGGSLRLAAGAELFAAGDATVGVGIAGSAEIGVPASAGATSLFTVLGSLGVGGDTPAELGFLRLANGVVDAGTISIGRFGEVRGIGTLRGSTAAGGDGTIRNSGIITSGIAIDGNLVNAPEGVVQLPPSGTQSAPLLNPLAASLPRVVRRARAPVPPPPSSPLGVSGDATLDGTLVLQFRNGFAPGQGDSFEILDVAGALSGDFAALEVQGLAAGADFDALPSPGGYTVTSLTDAVALPPISLKAKARVKETKKGGLKLKLKRSGDTSQALLVSYALGGTAKNGFDYDQLPGAVEIPAGKKTATIPLVPLADSLAEGSETVVLELLPGEGYSLPLDADVAVEIVDGKAKKR